MYKGVPVKAANCSFKLNHHELDFHEGSVTFANTGGSYSATRLRMPDYGEAVAGFTIASNTSVSGFMEATYTRTFKNGTGVTNKLEGAGGRVGINFKF